jgi:3-oxoacyl-[acyl-carrier-protein] synthase II
MKKYDIKLDLMKRVVVTGMGMVSPLGNDLGTSWKSLLAGKSGITSYENDPVLKNTSPVNLSLVKDFNFSKWKVAVK